MSTRRGAPTGPRPCAAHNWVVLGAVLHNPDQPAWFLPISGRLYFRKSQLPIQAREPGCTEPFRTKCQLALELIREQARMAGGLHLSIFNSGYALGSVVRPLVVPEQSWLRIEFLTQLRHDARIYRLPPEERPEGKRGPMPKWGKPLPPPRQGGRRAGPWHVGSAFIYGRTRKVRWKEVVCLWRVLGHDVQVKAVVAQVEGYKKRFTLVSSALELTGLRGRAVLCAVPARGRVPRPQAASGLGGVPGLDQEPDQRTSQAQWVTLSLLRLAQLRLESAGEVDWWFRPPWNQNKDRPSVLDLERLMRRHRAEIQRFLSEWLGDEQKTQEDVA